MSEAIKVQDDGMVLDHTPSAAVTGGEVRQREDGLAIVLPVDLAASEKGAGLAEGVFSVTKTASQVWVKGGPIWWDHSANSATCIPRMGAGDKDFYLGTATEDVASATTTGKVNLNVRPRYEIDLAVDPFDTTVVKTVVGSTTVEVPHLEPRGGSIAMIFGATAEAQKLDLISQRSFALGSNWIVEGEVCVIDDGDATAIDFNIGVANATHASDADSITESCFLHLDGNTLDLFAESDDGTTEVAATDTTTNIVLSTPFSFVMDGRNPADVQIYVDGVLQLGSTVFDISLATGPLKLLAHLEKTADDTTATYLINRLRVRTMQED